jgi:hypothetical protein
MSSPVEQIPDPTPAAKNTFSGYLKESWIIIVIICAMILLVLVIFYIFYLIKKNRLNNVVLHKEMIILDNRNVVPYTVTSDKMASLTSNGQEYSYSTWLYLSNNYDVTSGNKIILTRGNSESAPGMISPNTSPIVAMDAKTNKLYVGVSTSAVTNSMLLDNVFVRNASTGKYDSGFLISHVDYIPLQRWVNIVIVVRDMNMYVYIDGDIYSISSASQVKSNSTRPIIRGTSGDLVLGDKLNTIHGFLSLTQFYNYALVQKEVQTIYSSGPSPSSWLKMFGLGNYGVRNPVYKIS